MKRLRISAAVLLAAAVAGCAAPKPPPRPALAAPTLNGAAAPLAADWWRTLGDPQLARLVDAALAGNPTLAQVQARVARAQAAAAAAGAALRPSADAMAVANRGKLPPPYGAGANNLGVLQLGLSWELDLFGKQRAALDAAIGTAAAARADAAAARIALAAAVARAYIDFARISDQLQLAQRLLALRGQYAALLSQRAAAGVDATTDAAAAAAERDATAAQLAALREQQQLARTALAALTGELTVAPTLTPPTLTQLQWPALPAVLPSDLLGRRADVVAARWRVEAAAGDVDVARAQFLPSVNLMAVAGYFSFGFDQLLAADKQFWVLGPAVSLPLFTGGRLKANLADKNAALDGAIHAYNAAVVDALHDAGDQILSLSALAAQRAAQQQAVAGAQQAWSLTQAKFDAGIANRMQLLAAELALLAQQRAALELSARTATTQVALIKALGGGYAGDPSPGGGYTGDPLQH